MNKTILSAITAIAGLLVAIPLLAHDPSKHKSDNAQPNCEAMTTMDHSKMDMKDPVMMAMMKKCMHSMHGESKHTEMQEKHEMTGKAMDEGANTQQHAEGDSKPHAYE